MKIAYIDFWAECSNTPVNYDEINNIDSWTNLKLTRELKTINNGVGLFHIKKLEQLLNKKLELTNPENADILICSGFGNQRYLYPNKKKICLYYESDFKVPDFKFPEGNLPNTTYFSSNLNVKPEIFYLPLYTCYYGFSIYNFDYRNTISEELFNKKIGCLSVISNGKSSYRNNFLEQLMLKITVDNYGKIKHNKDNAMVQSSCWYDPRLCDVIKNYKFMLCMENTSLLGYHTEKIIHGFRNNIIPIYWGDPICKLIFNSKAYINVNELGIERAIDKIMLLSSNITEYNKMLAEPIFHKESLLFRSEFKKYLSEQYFIDTINRLFN